MTIDAAVGTVTPRDNPAVDQQGRSTLGYNRADDRNRRLNPATFLRPLRDDFKINTFRLFQDHFRNRHAGVTSIS